MPRKPRKPKPVAAKAREMFGRLEADGVPPEEAKAAVAKKLEIRPNVVDRSLERTGYRGRPREKGIPVRIRLPAEVVEAADARVAAGKGSDRNAVLTEVLRKALLR